MSRVALLLLFAPTAASAGDITGKVTVQGKIDGPVVVYVEQVTGAKATPARDVPLLTQRNMAFVPTGLVVPIGTAVQFPNEDNVFHNVFSLTAGNEFDLGLYRGGASKAEAFDKAGEVDVFCNIHPDMVAKILVVQNDFYVTVAGDGSYRIEGVPAGTYDVIAWSPVHEPARTKVIVAATGPVTQDFTVIRRDEGTHLNKDGEQYGRYR